MNSAVNPVNQFLGAGDALLAAVPAGYRPALEEIRVGDKRLAYNSDEGERETKRRSVDHRPVKVGADSSLMRAWCSMRPTD